MERAVVAIGVKKTGQLPELQAAVESAAQFADWATQHQRIPEDRVKLITDAQGSVSRDRIFETVDEIVQLGFIEQLIVYFSGHGINSGLFEQWLLSRAPGDPAAAVNVMGSAFGARFCGIGHVVFISDACRTAADSIQAQRVTGSDIFPNARPNGPERPVDQFFATLVGSPAYEVKTVEEAVRRYRAGYSTVLMKALRGGEPALIDSASGRPLIHPRPLKRHLATAVPSFYSAVNPGGVSAQPDARIESDPDAWIAELPEAGITLESALPAGAAPRAAPPPPVPARAASLEGVATDALSVALEAFRVGLGYAIPAPPRATFRRKRPADLDKPAQDYMTMVSDRTSRLGSADVACGVTVKGAVIKEAYARDAVSRIGTDGATVQVELPDGRHGGNLLVRVEDGSGVVVPIFSNLVTGLRFDADRTLEDMWYEAGPGTPEAHEYAESAAEMRMLRAVAAASTSLGVFRLEEGNPEALAASLRRAKRLDPALAVYAAYAFNDRRMRSDIIAMQRQLDRQLRARVFDVAMLSFALSMKPSEEDPREIYPCVPMLTQGWALLSPLGVTLPARLAELRGGLRPSLWTHFDSAAADRLREILST